MNDDIPVVKDLILIGGGHSHVCVLKKFGMHPEPGVRLTLVSDAALTPYSGMLPGFVAGHYTEEECHIDLVPLAKFAKARFILARACGLDREQRLVHLEGRPPLRYDILSIDIGISPGMHLKTSQQEALRVTPVKPISKFSAKWDQLIPRVLAWRDALSEQKCNRPMNITVVGGGAGGVELLLSIHHRLCTLLKEEHQRSGKGGVELSTNAIFQMSVATRGHTILSSHPPRVQRIFRRVLKERSIQVYYESEVVDVVHKEQTGTTTRSSRSSSTGPGEGGGVLVTIDGERIEFDECVWCTSAATQPWLRETGLELDAHGFIAIDDELRSVNVSGVRRLKCVAPVCTDIGCFPLVHLFFSFCRHQMYLLAVM